MDNLFRIPSVFLIEDGSLILSVERSLYIIIKKLKEKSPKPGPFFLTDTRLQCLITAGW